MFGRNFLKSLATAAVLAVMAGGAQAATVTYQSVEANPKVNLMIDDSIAGRFRFTLTTIFGVADFLALGFDFTGVSIAQSNLVLQNYTPIAANTPKLKLFGNNTNLQNTCGNGCNFNGAGSDPGPYDYIIRIGENGGGRKKVSSIMFDIITAGSLAANPFANFGVRAQGTSGLSNSIKFGLVEILPPPPVPVPAAGLLLLGALGGLAALRRRRTA